MNIKQKIVLSMGIIVIVVMGLFPPWVLLHSSSRGWGYEGRATSKFRDFRGYQSIWIQNYPKDSIDFQRLGLQWAIVGVVTGGLIVILKKK